jgi:TatD DNase family protein
MSQIQFVDTHTHLDDPQFADDQDDVIDIGITLGVCSFVNVGYRPGVWETTLALASRRPEVRFALGLHPGHADLWSEDLSAQLTALVEEHEPVAIGEIGIDYFWTDETRDIQQVAFERQIEIAHGHQLPVVIHQRSAASDVCAILRNAPTDIRVVLHSFDGDPALAELAEERSWYLGVGGLATRRQQEELRRRLMTFPLDRLLLETDSPYLVPSGIKERRNTPAMIPVIAERLAGIRQSTVDTIANQTTANARSLFGLGVPVTNVH